MAIDIAPAVHKYYINCAQEYAYPSPPAAVPGLPGRDFDILTQLQKGPPKYSRWIFSKEFGASLSNPSDEREFNIGRLVRYHTSSLELFDTYISKIWITRKDGMILRATVIIFVMTPSAKAEGFSLEQLSLCLGAQCR
jgi:hypothetical protein